MDLLRAALNDELRVHPRISQQPDIRIDDLARQRLADTLPRLVPFRGRTFEHMVAVLDWDHRLPSRRYTLRLHVLYTQGALGRFESSYESRLAEIQRRDLYPEFDVPDFSELPADEVYEADVQADFAVEAMRLVSAWRREVPTGTGERAVEVVRGSREFRDVRAAAAGRPMHLGDLEAVGWAPPCESGHAHWTIDVWWLTSFDGRFGRGWSFLVEDEDGGEPKVVAHREFSIRTA